MNLTILITSFLFNLLLARQCGINEKIASVSAAEKLTMGAEDMNAYLPLLQGKRIALVVNQTSQVYDQHLVDTLLSLQMNVKKVFAPEHGFRGEADAGEIIKSGTDPKTKLPLISLYGDNKKPTAKQLEDIDVVIFDIQDVGARFYTYISTLHYVMEACAENNKKLIVLDRPNPNGSYVDGPVLEPAFSSFVGLHPIPIVHGLTVGELAMMINGENWLKGGLQCKVEIIQMHNYQHDMSYALPVKPSPNLPNEVSIALYPSLCLFEGTIISVGRGTPFPFQVAGHPDEVFGNFTFTPTSMAGAKSPMYNQQQCHGIDLRTMSEDRQFTLKYLIDFYQKSPDKGKFFNSFFNKLAGTAQLMEQIKAGLNESDIRKTWEPALGDYKRMRTAYLLYPDFK